MDTPLRQSPLLDEHVRLGATLGPFGGWQMPISYPAGTVAEHTAVRETVGIFDVSHLGKTAVTGPGASSFVNTCLTADLDRIGPGQAQYTMCCADDGGVIDDLIAYLVNTDEVFCVPNAANTSEFVARLAGAAPDGVAVTDRQGDFAVLAVQGPASAQVLDAVGLPTGMDYMSFTEAAWGDGSVLVGRTGYTGERGYELLPAADRAAQLWRALLDVADRFDGRASGLAARDTLRTEAGLPLHGQDLSREITPVQAGASFAVGWNKPAFWGREALLAERERGPARRLRGLRASGRGVPRPEMTVRAGGAEVGETTSGTFSPTLRTGIALALLDAAVEPGHEVEIDVRGRALACEVVKPPFVPSRVRS